MNKIIIKNKWSKYDYSTQDQSVSYFVAPELLIIRNLMEGKINMLSFFTKQVS